MTLFRACSRLGAFTPEERARAVTERLEKLANDPFRKSQPVTVLEGETTSEIVADEVVIATVTDGDAKAAGRPRPELTKD